MFKAFKDNIWTGLGIGLLVPGLLIGITWYIMHAVAYLAKLDLLLIGCIAVNALMLKFVFKENKDNIGRGLIIATFAWGMAFFYYKLSKS